MAILALALFLDFGTPDSPVMENWTAVTPTTLYTADSPGWVDPPPMQPRFRAWPRKVENPSRGTMDPPPVYTNDLTADALTSDQPATLRANLPAGDYELWFVAGSSEPTTGQVWDFTVAVGEVSSHVQIEGGYWFETRRLRFHADGPTDITITPKSRWILAALAIRTAADADQARLEGTDDIAETERCIYLLPSDILADWKLTPHVDPAGPLPEFPAEARAAGYVVHTRPWAENIYPETVPYPATFNPTLEAFASLGEYEPLTFAVYAIEDLVDCRVTVSDLTGPGTIRTDEIDLKMVQFANSRPNYTAVGSYKVVPDYLRTFETVDVPAARNQRFWLTVHVPENAEPGIYTGTIEFTARRAGQTVQSRIPIRFRVLPIRLQQDPERVYGIYYRDPLDRARNAADDYSREYYERQAEIQGADMNAHGTVLCVPLSAWISVPRDSAQPIEFKFDWEALARRIERCHRFGYDGPFVMSINTGGLYERHMGERFGSHLRGAKPCPPAFSEELRAMIAYLEAGRKERGMPEFLYYPVDEPGGNPDQVAFMVQCLEAIRAAGARTYVTADPTHEVFEPMRPYVDVWCTQPFLPDRDTILKDSAERGVEYWCYPNHINGENDHTTVAGARMTYGFGFWRSGFKVLIPWIYSSTGGHPFNNLDASSADFFNRPGPDGTVWPVPMWEAYREGYDDYRYVYTCAQLVEQARRAGQTTVADRAQAVLDATWDAIEVKPKYKLDSDVWGYREFDLRRWQIAEQILALQDALR